MRIRVVSLLCASATTWAACAADPTVEPGDAVDAGDGAVVGDSAAPLDTARSAPDTATPACSPPCASPGGRCVDGACECLSGWVGARCELRDRCADRPCNNGTCTSTRDGFVCDCAPGFGGATCAELRGVNVTTRLLGEPHVDGVIWDVEVTTDDETVLRRRLSSPTGWAYAAGPCVVGAQHTARVWLVGTFASGVPAGAAGDFGESLSGSDLVPTTYVNPTWDDRDGDGLRGLGDGVTPLERRFTCVDETGVSLDFDLALARPASVGFFDRAVDIAGVFCTASFDCCADADGDGVCSAGEVVTRLRRSDGAPGPTTTLHVACAGLDAGGTELLLDDLHLDCTDGAAPFSPDVTLRPLGDGEVCATGMSGCAGVTERGGFDADEILFQYAVDTTTDQALGYDIGRWDVALGVEPDAITACRLRTRATAIDASGPSGSLRGQLTDSYPHIAVDVAFDACASERLSFGGSDDAVRVTVPPPDGVGPHFANHLPIGGEAARY